MNGERGLAEFDKTLAAFEDAATSTPEIDTARRLGAGAIAAETNAQMRPERPHLTLVPPEEVETFTFNEELNSIIGSIIKDGFVLESNLEAALAEVNADDDDRALVMQLLEEREIEILETADLPQPVHDENTQGTSETFKDSTERMLDFSEKLGILTADEEKVLAKRIEEGSLVAKQELIERNLLLVAHIARSFFNRGMNRDDLIQEGMLGLIRATEKFDWRKGNKFSTYATWWIWQAMQRAIISNVRTIYLPVHVSDRHAKLRNTRRLFEVKNGREPTFEEMVNESGISEQHAFEAWYAPHADATLNSPVGGDGDAELIDFIDSDGLPGAVPSRSSLDVADENYRSAGVRRIMEERLTDRQRQVLDMRFGFSDGKEHTLDEIAKMMGVTKERVRQMEEKALKKLNETSTPEELKALKDQDSFYEPIVPDKAVDFKTKLKKAGLPNLEHLNPRESLVIHLRVKGLKNEEIARRTGIKYNSVSDASTSARNKLKGPRNLDPKDFAAAEIEFSNLVAEALERQRQEGEA